MEYNRKIDALVAEHIMGWKPHEFQEAGFGYMICPKRGQAHIYPDFSTDLRDAFLVVEELRSLGMRWNLYSGSCNKSLWVVEVGDIDDPRNEEFFDKSLPLAICKAALKMKGIKIGEKNEYV